MQAVSHVLLALNKPLQDEIITESGLKLFIDPSYEPEWNATTTGTVKSIPDKYSWMNIKPEDEVAISYRVVTSRDYYSSSDSYFMPITAESEHYKKWMNHKGEILSIGGYKKENGFIGWFGSYRTSAAIPISGIHGTQAEVERWLTQFSFGKTEGFKFNNLVEIEGQPLWLANAGDIFAKKDGDGIFPLTDKIFCEPLDMDLTQKMKILHGVAYPDYSVQGRWVDRGVALFGYPDKGIEKGDILSFEYRFVQEYKFWGKDYFLIDQDFVKGKWV